MLVLIQQTFVCIILPFGYFSTYAIDFCMHIITSRILEYVYKTREFICILLPVRYSSTYTTVVYNLLPVRYSSTYITNVYMQIITIRVL